MLIICEGNVNSVMVFVKFVKLWFNVSLFDKFQFSKLTLTAPDTIIKVTTNKLTAVNTLFKRVDSLTPIARTNVTRHVMPNAKKSGYVPYLEII